MIRFIKFIAPTTLVLLAAASAAVRSDDVKPTPETKKAPLAWSKKPVKEWPQLVLTNEAAFKGHSPLKGASSFLMQVAENEVVLVTARHLIGKEGGVEPPVALAKFEEALQSWEAYPRTKPEARVAVKGLAMFGEAGERQDWLLLSLKDSKGVLPATPMQPSAKRAEIGDVAFLIGVPYSDAKSSQNVYKGKVTKRPSRNYFELEFEPAVKLAGFSGAPVVDADGYLLGMLTTSPESKRTDGLNTACWCQDISLARSLWKKKNNAPTTSKTAVELALPAGWKEKSSSAQNVLMFAEYPPLDASIQLQVFPAERLKEVVTLKDWATRNEKTKLAPELDDRHQTELISIQIGGHEAYEYQVSGKIKDMPVHYRMILFERNESFCSLLCWTSEENWSKAQPKFEEVFKAIK